MWKNFKRKWLRKWLEFRYRNQDSDTCCCGGIITPNCYTHCEGKCLSMKAYVIDKEIDRRIP